MSHSQDYQTIAASIVVVQNQEGKYLFLQRSQEEAYAAGTWDFPGGAKDFLESTEDAAKRECFEETGLLVNLKRLIWHRVTQGGLDKETEFVSFYYLATTESTEVQVSSEHNTFQWLTLDEGRNLETIPWMTKFYEALDAGQIDLS